MAVKTKARTLRRAQLLSVQCNTSNVGKVGFAQDSVVIKTVCVCLCIEMNEKYDGSMVRIFVVN
jgi:hypothetical protein